MSEKTYYVYIMTNLGNTVLYTGVTNDLSRRLEEHRAKVVKGFTSRYNVSKLVYAEVHATADDAITREKQIKGGSRKKKIQLIEAENPDWRDISDLLT